MRYARLDSHAKLKCSAVRVRMRSQSVSAVWIGRMRVDCALIMSSNLTFSLPLDVFPVIFRHLSQKGLCDCLRVCRDFHRMITTDQVLLARLQCVSSYRQFKSYLQVGRTFYRAELLFNIGQNDDAKFPYCYQFVVTKLDHARDKPEMYMEYANVTPPGDKCSMVFSEKVFAKFSVIYGVNKMNVMFRLLSRMWWIINNPIKIHYLATQGKVSCRSSPTIEPFLKTNMRKAIKHLKRHMAENAKFGELVMLRAAHTKWFQEVMALRPEDEPESSSDEETSPEVPREIVGKPPIYFCKIRCKRLVGGFTCRSPNGNETCGELLVIQRDTSLRCPKGCGVMAPPVCCRGRAMKVITDPRYTITASSPQKDISRIACPVFSCIRCKFGVDGIRCFTCTFTGKNIERSGTILRDWCANVWVCPKRCGIIERGGMTYGGFFSCRCQGRDTPLVEYAYEDKFGPP